MFESNPPRLPIKTIIVIIILSCIFSLGIYLGTYYNKTLKIKSANKEYLKQSVIIARSAFQRVDQDKATVVIIIDNVGNRIIDSLPVEIDYYGQAGKLLGRDSTDILSFVNDVLLPAKRRVFEINVICPIGTTDAKVRINS